MLDFATYKTELLRMVDDTSIVSATQGKLVNIGYRKVRKDIAQHKPDQFETVKTTITITAGLGDLPLGFIAVREILDADGNHVKKKPRNLMSDSVTGSSPLYWFLKGRKTTADYNRQIGVRPVIASGSIYAHLVLDADDLDGTGDVIDLPDEDAQRIGLLYSAYEYYQSKRRWSDAQNMLNLYTARLADYVDDFDEDEEELLEEGGSEGPNFTFSN